MDRLNLGCMDDYREGWVNLDIVEPADIVHDVTLLPWPFDDASFDHILASDILEHLPVGSFTGFMNECHRVLRDPGVLDVIVPVESHGFWIDPTHVRPYTAETFTIFCTRDNREGGYEDTHLGLIAWEHVETRMLNRPQTPAVHARLWKGTP